MALGINRNDNEFLYQAGQVVGKSGGAIGKDVGDCRVPSGRHKRQPFVAVPLSCRHKLT